MTQRVGGIQNMSQASSWSTSSPSKANLPQAGDGHRPTRSVQQCLGRIGWSASTQTLGFAAFCGDAREHRRRKHAEMPSGDMGVRPTVTSQPTRVLTCFLIFIWYGTWNINAFLFLRDIFNKIFLPTATNLNPGQWRRKAKKSGNWRSWRTLKRRRLMQKTSQRQDLEWYRESFAPAPSSPPDYCARVPLARRTAV